MLSSLAHSLQSVQDRDLDSKIMIKQNVGLCDMRRFSVYWPSEGCVRRFLQLEDIKNTMQGANLKATQTQCGGRKAPLPWAKIYGPYRANNHLPE